MRRHWQRKPLLVRQAVPGFVPPLGVEALLELATRDDVESRVIEHGRRGWTLRHGPFEPEDLPARSKRAWTVLVQGIDLHDDEASALMHRFGFVPFARVDDLMASFATDGGGVGPHVDSYDVFLLQAHGKRRWRIAPPGDASLVPDVPLKMLRHFEPTQEWVLEPGDMLYLPPGWKHDGVAEGECVTYSIGFRAPSRHELLSAFLAQAADRLEGADPRFGDARRPVAERPGELPADLLDFARRQIEGWKPSAREIARFMGEFLTEPKPQVFFDPPARATSLAAFAKSAAARGLRLDRRTRMLHAPRALHVNGETTDVTATVRRLLAPLADARVLSPAQAVAALADPAAGTLLHGWHEDGWLHLRAAVPAGHSRRT